MPVRPGMLLGPGLVLLLGACASRAALPAGQAVGGKIEPRESVRFAIVEADPPAFFERTLLVEATVVAVCQKAGCWMQVEDGGRSAMVRWETGCGGKYLFPGDLAGRRVLIQGSFYPKSISEEDALHLEQEAGDGVTIPRETFELNASAILVLDRAR